ncbi:MAG TPA: lysylphosphatidylglycerol synthase domain-containing protein [Aliidongia sp.]|uniref:lysylphosphatidylglycerol synthase domain-containing protein n=1 Tax=Aliidongia sp. TaxID=1914230 RepID=UPI002DDCE9E0|nr:lysylphosphatidylglycerol synthase domain-containing protein [Aliidongia sp.]HEV2675095.1 lysylphosphatidylglycerol synthase domain-containing protein [Aliidongia sp.]
MIRSAVLLALVIGIVAFVAILVTNGFADIIRGVATIGWGLVAIVLIRLVALTLAGAAWGLMLGHQVDRPAGLYVGLRVIREAINSLLPAVQVGGDIVGGRLLAQYGVPAGLAAASILVDLLLQTATQGLFAVSGLAALWLAFGDTPVVREIGGGLIVAVPALGGFFLAQRLGLFALVDRGMGLIQRFLPALVPARPLDLQSGLRSIYGAHGRIAGAGLVHLLGWCTGILEIWLALGRMGVPIGFAEALVLESLGQAVRSAAFAVPGALGIQEGGFVLLGGLFGLSPATSLSLSLVKRLPDLAIGLPGLAAWQMIEIRKVKLPPLLRRGGA